MADVKNTLALLDSLDKVATVAKTVFADGHISLLELPALFPLISEAEKLYRTTPGIVPEMKDLDAKEVQMIAERTLAIVIKFLHKA